MRLSYIVLLLSIPLLCYSNQDKGLFFIKATKNITTNSTSELDNQLYFASGDKENTTIRKATTKQLIRYYKNKNRNFLFFIHGYGKNLNEVINRARQIEDIYKVNVCFLYWPYQTNNGKKTTLKQARTNIESHLPGFQNLLTLHNLLVGNFPESKHSIMAHSLGNYFFESYFSKTNNQITTKAKFDNLILNSAAVNDKHHSKWLAKMNIQKNIYITFNKHDFILRGMQIFTHSKRPLGVNAKSKRLNSATYINMSETVGYQKGKPSSHSYFIGEMTAKKEVYEMYLKLFNGDQY
ncbi:MAG: alpha/beta hydrolase [Marinilabiliaceae bacterium]|nr:alpha/beta hydrolase [Marinilabiliaceae bacterium]